MLGKNKCKILKEIRQRIADENDIPYVTSECTHQGDCSGVCPRCESELRYLERELAARQAMGRTVTVAALCAGLVATAAGCTPVEALPDGGQTAGAVAAPADELAGEPLPEERETLPVPDGDTVGADGVTLELGELPAETVELAGDVAFEPEPAESDG